MAICCRGAQQRSFRHVVARVGLKERLRLEKSLTTLWS
jgi:hypothetical protein